MVSSVCLDPVEFYFPVLILHFDHFLSNFFDVWFFRFLSDSNVILLPVDISTLLSLVSENFKFSSAFSIASCSAWLFEHRPFNLYFFVSINLLSLNMAILDPTPCSLLLPSVYTCMLCLLSS